ncbi:TonB-dependent receptor [Novosphingobium colocasiae]|uniref:TonB-dependent receptor n=1 Tax=Novosphingobium colocasiae TaxID=1256513 RepID=UPI0035AF976E
MNDNANAHFRPRHAARSATWMCGIAFGALLAPVVQAQTTATLSVADQSEISGKQSGASDQSGIGDIIVTAQKRSESVQKTPLAITAIGGDALRISGVSNVTSIVQSVPSLQLGKFYGVANVTLRGIALSALNAGVESPVAFHVDGVYFGRPAAVLSSFYDVQRVEVLRGAQGTLYGRNATGGSINIITADPTSEFSGFAQATYGNYNHLAVEAAISGPLADKVQFRIAGRWDSHDGYGINEFTGRKIDDNHERAIRGKLKFEPADNLTILLEGDYAKANSNGAIHLQGTVAGGPVWGTLANIGPTPWTPGTIASNIRNVSQDTDPVLNSEFWGLASTISLELGSVTLRSISSYRKSKSLSVGDIDLTSSPLVSPFGLSDDAEQYSQELQVVGQTERSNWIVGGYYYHEKDQGREVSAFSNVFLPLFGAPLPADGVYNTAGLYTGTFVKTDAYAIFGQYTYKFFDKLSVTLGGRYSIETKEQLNQNNFDLGTRFDYSKLFSTPPTVTIQCGVGVPTIGYSAAVPCQPKKTFKAFTPKIGIDFQASPDVLLYASYSKGFKSGTFNLGAAQAPVKPEKLDDFELGIKSTLLNGLLRANLAGFYYNYKDVQVFNGLPTTTFLENAASARIYGLEAEIVAKPVPPLQFDLTGSWLHTGYRNYKAYDQLRPAGDGVTQVPDTSAPGTFVSGFNLDGNHLPQAPEFSGRVGAAYTLFSGSGDFTLRGEAVYTSKVYITQFNTCPVGCVAGHTRFNASLNWVSSDGRLTASLNGKNLANKVLLTSGFAGTPLVGGLISGYLEPPRTVDFTVGYKF